MGGAAYAIQAEGVEVCGKKMMPVLKKGTDSKEVPPPYVLPC